MQNENLKYTKKFLIDSFGSFWGNKVQDYVIEELGHSPHEVLTIEFKLYNYFPIRLNLEMDKISFSIIFSHTRIMVSKHEFSFENIDNIIESFDNEILLRIPDKFLIAKGWM